VYLLGAFTKGPISIPTKVNGPIAYLNKFGSALNDEDEREVQRYLSYGVPLVISRVAHYTDITSKSTLTSTRASINGTQSLSQGVQSSAYQYQITFNSVMVAGDSVTFDWNGFTLLTASMALTGQTSEQFYTSLATQLQATSAVATATYLTSVLTITMASGQVPIPGPSTGLSLSGYRVSNPANQPGLGWSLVRLPSVDDFGPVIPSATGSYNLFNIVSSGYGSYYNRYSIVIGAATTAGVNAFKLTIMDVPTGSIVKTYDNLSISGNPTASESNYLKQLSSDDLPFIVVYYDLSPYTPATLRPANGTYPLVGGTNGGAIIDSDYIGNSVSKTGAYAFDSVNDGRVLSAVGNKSVNVYNGLTDYAISRNFDLMAFLHIDEGINDVSDLVTARNLLTSSRLSAVFTGGVKYFDVKSNTDKTGSELSEAGPLYMLSWAANGPQYAVYNSARGKFRNATGVVTNFGGGDTESVNNREQLSQAGINISIQENGGSPMLWHDLTMSPVNSLLSYTNVVMTLIDLSQKLKPMLKQKLGNPFDLYSLNDIALEVEAITDGYKRAFYKTEFIGDQHAKTESNLLLNTPTDLVNGIYHCKLLLYPIGQLTVIELNISANKLSVQIDG